MTDASSPHTSSSTGSIWPQLRRFGTQSVVYAGGSMIARLVGFILIPLYTSYLTSAEYGVVSLLVLVTQVVSTIASLGLLNSLFRLWPSARDTNARNRLFSSVILTQLSAGATVTLLVALLPQFWSRMLLGPANWGIYVVLAVSIGALDMVVSTPLGILRMEERPVLFVVANLIRAVVSLGVAIWLIAGFGMGIAGVLWANLIGVTATLFFLSPVFVRHFRLAVDISLLGELLPFGLWYMVGVVAGLFWNMGDRYVLKYLIGLYAVGVYGLGHQLAGTMNMLGQSLISAFIPIGLKYPKTTDGGRFVAKTLTYLALGFVWVALGFSLLSRELIYLLAQRPDFYAAWHVVPFLTLGFVFYTLTAALEIGFYFAGVARQNTGIIIGTLVANIGLNFLLIPYFGILGSAFAAVIAAGGRLALSYYWAQRLYPLPYEIKRVAMIIAVAVFYHVAFLAHGPLWMTASLKVALTCTFPIALWSMGFFTEHERKQIRAATTKLLRRK